MARGGGQQQNSGQGSMDLLYISIFITLACAFVWFKFHAQLVDLLYRVKIHEIDLTLWCLSYISPLLKKVGLSLHHMEMLRVLRSHLIQADTSTVNLPLLWSNLSVLGAVWRYPIALIGFLMIVHIAFFSVGSKFNVIFSMEKLRMIDVSEWPLISPVRKTKNLVKVDLDDRSWGMAERPFEFSENHGILRHTTKEGMPAVEVEQNIAHKVFSMQMGALWQGLESLPPHTQALFAVFAAKAEKDGVSANKLLMQIAASALHSKKLDFSGTRELLVKYLSTSEIVGRAVAPHAYILTVMASMLEAARTDGVLASAEFLWLKPIDRSLWYMLSSVGRQTPFCEASGPFSHWLVEKRLRRPLKVPMVDMAVEALVDAMAQIKYNPDGY